MRRLVREQHRERDLRVGLVPDGDAGRPARGGVGAIGRDEECAGDRVAGVGPGDDLVRVDAVIVQQAVDAPQTGRPQREFGQGLQQFGIVHIVAESRDPDLRGLEIDRRPAEQRARIVDDAHHPEGRSASCEGRPGAQGRQHSDGAVEQRHRAAVALPRDASERGDGETCVGQRDGEGKADDAGASNDDVGADDGGGWDGGHAENNSSFRRASRAMRHRGAWDLQDFRSG